MHDWNIHYADREFAREMGDPCLGTVTARTKQDAERIAAYLDGFGAGVWATPATPNRKH